ncbi:MAG TPA: hypothetical protein ENN29_10825, partial [Candidatus Hydrogenedentes bacterium]|nr:hypothetical protein [Candidatus Hydrogenedentota bacterium]
MNRKSISSRAAVALMGAAIFTLGMSASAVTMSDLMKYLPQDAQIAIGLPDIEAVESAGAPLLKNSPLSRIGELAVMLGGDTVSEGLADCGVKAAAPGAVFIAISPENDVKVSGVLMVDDAEKIKEAMVGLLSGEGAEVALPGDLKGRFVAGSGVGYFINGDKLFVGSSEALLEQLAARIDAPAEVHYEAKDEVVVWSRIDAIENGNLLSLADELAYLKPILSTLKPFSDEVLLAIGEDAGSAYVRAAARDAAGEPVASPGALALHGYMDAAAPVLLNLRITPQLVNAVSMALATQPSTRQIGGYIRMAYGLLGDEMAVSLRGMKTDKIPDAIIAATLKNAATVPNLLKMLANIEAPTYQHEETDVYVYEDNGLEIHVAVAGDVLVVAPGGDDLKAAL